MLHQVALARPLAAGICHQPAHGVQLVVARENQLPLAGLLPGIVLHLVFVNEGLQQVQQTFARPCLLPQIGGGKALPGGRVTGPQVVAFVEGHKARRCARQAGGEVDPIRIYGKVRQAAPEGEERLFGVARGAVLVNGVLHRLAGERVLQLGRKEGQAVQKDRQVQAVLVLLAVLKLAHYRKLITFVQKLRIGVEASGRAEIGQMELAAQIFEAIAQHIQRAAAGNFLGQPGQEMRRGIFARQALLQLLPLLWLGDVDEIQHLAAQQAQRLVIFL